MWFPLTAIDSGYASTCPFHLHFEGVVDQTPERVFDVFAEGEGMREWFHDFVACRWTSEPPHGVGATREVLLKLLSVKERFVVWERGKRAMFVMDGITLPLVRSLAEDLTFEAEGERTRVKWRVCYEPTLAMRVVHPLARAIFGRMFRKSLEGLARYAARPR